MTKKDCQWKTIAGHKVLLKKDGTICGGDVPRSWQGKRLQDEPWKDKKGSRKEIELYRYESKYLYEGAYPNKTYNPENTLYFIPSKDFLNAKTQKQAKQAMHLGYIRQSNGDPSFPVKWTSGSKGYNPRKKALTISEGLFTWRNLPIKNSQEVFRELYNRRKEVL